MEPSIPVATALAWMVASGRGDHLPTQNRCAIPVTRLPQYRGQASQAELGGGLEGICGTETERLVVGLLGRRIVAGVLERVRQPLIDLGRRSSQPVLQGHRQPGPDQIHPNRTFAHPCPRIALVPQDPRLEIDAMRLTRLLPGDLQQADGCAEAPGGSKMGRGGDTLRCGVGR